jgi:hypothetical protein
VGIEVVESGFLIPPKISPVGELMGYEIYSYFLKYYILFLKIIFDTCLLK